MCSCTRCLDLEWRAARPYGNSWATGRCHWGATAGGLHLPLQLSVRMCQQLCLPLSLPVSLSVWGSVQRQVPLWLSVRMWVHDCGGGGCVFGQDVRGNTGGTGDRVDHTGGYCCHGDHPCCHGDTRWRRVDCGHYLAPGAWGRGWGGGLWRLSCG